MDTTSHRSGPAVVQTWRLRRLEGAARLLFPWNLFWDQRSVLLTLVRSQIARRHRRSFLGWAWNIIQPGSQALLLFGATRAALHVPSGLSGIGGFGVFFAAFIIAQGMGEIVSRGPSLVAERPAWVKGSLFPLELLAPTAVGVALYRIIPGGLIGIIAVTIGDGVGAGFATLMAFAVGLAMAIVWGTTLALGFAALGVYLRDAILAAPIITLAMIFISPLYINEGGGGLLAFAVALNPLTASMEIVLSGLGWMPANGAAFAAATIGSLAALWLAAQLFRRLSANFSDFV
jgi:lipopolysaccharide transport system permease protein